MSESVSCVMPVAESPRPSKTLARPQIHPVLPSGATYRAPSQRHTFVDHPHHTPDLTEKIQVLGTHPCDGGSFGDIWKCRYDKRSGAIEVGKILGLYRLGLNIVCHILTGCCEGFAIQLDSKLCQGPYSGILTGSVLSAVSDYELVVKRHRREIGIWRRLKHPNIVPFLGIASGFGPYTSLVSVWMPGGTLQSHLRIHDEELSLLDRLLLLGDIAAGLKYLHVYSVIHGDLTCNNVLIDERSRARLVDFGFATVIGDLPEGLTYLRRSTHRPGAIRWAAPERFLLEDDEVFRPGEGSDIYSFGNIMLQVVDFYVEGFAPTEITLFRSSRAKNRGQK
ncbi:hypothetical protein HYDPIDRAFT_32938 [Hydnomerulius pinastri MD-312]|uniref:Protein kinase domain-containing protein n=1 Tax=Hydnomerulius pinastri MD-312 TaxID=994086 RepID=A0A0C9W9T8_9AGAM|nr:hypothetical protein HYDPIDRAFT_32938 [Hydnomerulius pinastri MD-312]